MVTKECRTCHRVFNRAEHLRRHEHRHTGAKPYPCAHCPQSFSRKDTLVRHKKLHPDRGDRGDGSVGSPERAPHDGTIRSDFTQTSPPEAPEAPVLSPVVSEAPGLSPAVSEAPGLSPVVSEAPVLSPVVSEAPVLSPVVSEAPGLPPMVSEAPFVYPMMFDGPRLPSITQLFDQTSAMDLDCELIWPQSEDFLQALVSTDGSNPWQMSLDTPSSSHMVLETSRSFEAGSSSKRAVPSGADHQAVKGVSRVDSSVVTTAAATLNSITSSFLDGCLHMFFEKFIPIFPVLNRATFDFRHSAQPLLLNAIAIGSLYLGPKDALEKGEELWHHAQTAVTASSQMLITQRGPYDACDGVQLVLTGVLSQIYGVLSKNRGIRSKSQASHLLAFHWARRCGMLDSEPYRAMSVPPLDASDLEKENQWRLWSAREIQQRSLLALYMLDGLVSQMSGEPTSMRHDTNPLYVPSNEAAFQALTADEWISQMRTAATSRSASFRSILWRLFRPGKEAAWLDTNLSAFSYKVVLEGLQSLLSDSDSEEPAIVGVPPRSEVRRALSQMHESIRMNASMSSADRLETLLRWHAICLDTSVDSSILCRNLCAKSEIKQHVWREGRKLKANMDLASWPTTPAARRALLHAMAIREIVEQLPRGRAHAIHVPSSLFSAAAVYSVFALGGGFVVKIPSTVTWPAAFLDVRPNEVNSPVYGNSAMMAESDTARYIRGDHLQGADVTPKHLLYELSSMQNLFGWVTEQWGLAYDMEAVVEEWIGLCH